jgi:hypothetical protein
MKTPMVVLLLGTAVASFGGVALASGITLPDRHGIDRAGNGVTATTADPKPVSALVGVGALIAGVLIGASALVGRRA